MLVLAMSKARKKSIRTRKSTAKPIQQALRRWAGGSSLLAALLVVLAATGMFPLSSLPPNVQDWLSLLTGRHLPPTASNTSNQNQSATAGKGRHYGQVERVSDGDTLTFITTEGARLKVRLASIDAPETAHGNARKGQAFGEQSGQSLREMAQGKRAELECFEVDRYQRSVCRVIVDGVDVNAEQVRRGMAWVYRANRRYVRDSSLYAVEDEAKAAKRGLWRAARPIAPWDWRKDCWQNGVCS